MGAFTIAVATTADLLHGFEVTLGTASAKTSATTTVAGGETANSGFMFRWKL
jgi:hypothetical protein